MFARIILNLTIIGSLSAPAFAQYDTGFPASGTGAGNTTAKTWQQATPLAGSAPNAGLGDTFVTGTQGASQAGGPKLQGSSSGSGGSSGAATSAPFVGGYSAPGNFALRQQGLSSLPPTRLDSFVKNAGAAEQIYGDEGTDGPPPESNFQTIGSGITSGGLTTGHQSALPSAWGTPW